MDDESMTVIGSELVELSWPVCGSILHTVGPPPITPIAILKCHKHSELMMQILCTITSN